MFIIFFGTFEKENLFPVGFLCLEIRPYQKQNKNQRTSILLFIVLLCVISVMICLTNIQIKTHNWISMSAFFNKMIMPNFL